MLHEVKAMANLLQDLRYGIRMLLKRPGFTAVAVLTLTLGIGANSAIFSVVNAVLIRSLPFPDSDRLVVVFGKTQRSARNQISYPDLQDARNQSKLFAYLSGWTSQTVNLTGGEEPTRVRGGFVSANFFKMLEVGPAQGREFLPADEQPGAERVVVVSQEVWRNRLGADPNAAGKTLILNGEIFKVIGVLPRGFRFPFDEIDVWIPVQHYPNFSMERRNAHLVAFGRLKPGVHLDQARAEMETIARRLERQYPDTNAGLGVNLVKLQELTVEDIQRPLLVLLGAVGFVLLIACANVANLMLAKAPARQREIAVRTAIGASRYQIVRQLLIEGVLLWLLGGGLGLLVTRWVVDSLVAMSPSTLPIGTGATIDANVLAFTLVISISTGMVFGLVPAIQSSKPNLNRCLKESGRSLSTGHRQARVRSILVISQVTLALVLLIGSALMFKSFRRLTQVEPGFNPENVLTMEYRVPRKKYPEGGRQWRFHQQVVERVRALPGVQSASVVLALPFSGNGGTTNFVLPDRPLPQSGAEPRAQVNRADPYYFETLGIPLMKGRYIGIQDHERAPHAVVVNQTMARQWWPSEDPIGKIVRFLPGGETATVVGVVGDVKQYDFGDKNVSQIYTSFAQNPHIFATLVVRTRQEPMQLSNAVRNAVWSIDREQPVWKVRTLESLLELSVADRRFITILLGVYAALALTLSTIGIYGVISYSVSQSTHDIGIRMALGARDRDVLRMVLRQGAALIVVGVTAGLAGSYAATGVIKKMLFEVERTDPWTLAGVSLVLAAVALLATYIPARRATKIDPMLALRYE